MKSILLFLLLFTIPAVQYAQPGTSVQYEDSAGPVNLNYNGMQDGKVSYQGTDAGFTIDLYWSPANSRWEILLNGGGNMNDLLFANANDTPNPPSTTAAPAMGEWTDEDGGDDTSLVSILGTGTQPDLSLPVTLLNFTVELSGHTAMVNWATSSETNNNYFSIERSIDGRTFTEIATQVGAGTETRTQTYVYADKKPLVGRNYYRLKQVDYDGHFSYSEIASVDFLSNGNTVLSPNPARAILNLRGEEAWEDTVELIVLSNDGKTLRTIRYDHPGFQIGLDVSKLNAGVYYLRVVTRSGAETQRFVKQ